jgi:hypothetical protein
VVLQIGLELAASIGAIAVDLRAGLVGVLVISRPPALALTRPLGLVVVGLVVVGLVVAVGCPVGVLVEEVDDEVLGYSTVTGVSPGDGGSGDDLAVRVRVLFQ